MKIVQQRVSGWLAKDISGKQGSCRNHLTYLHMLVFEQKRTALLGWGSYDGLSPCKESHQNKILAWQCRQACLPYSLPQCSKPCISFSGDRQVSSRQIPLHEKDGRCLPSLICLVIKLSYYLHWVPEQGVNALLRFTGLHANLSPVMHC